MKIRKKNIYTLLWILISCILAIFFLFSLEVVVRMKYPEFLKEKVSFYDINRFCVFDVNLGWRHRKNVIGKLRGKKVSINNIGFRGRDVDFKNKIKKRILMLGDSITFGLGVADDETFSTILDADDNFGFEVINSGVCGYGPDQELLLYEKDEENIRELTTMIEHLEMMKNKPPSITDLIDERDRN